MTLGVGLLTAKPMSALDSRLAHPLISAREARPLIEAGEVDVIDARDLKVQLWVGHIPGALHLPWRALTKGKRDGTLIEDHALVRRLDELGLTPSRPIVIYAGWGSGWGEEARALWSLEYAGHSKVQVIEGGWEAWREAGGARALGRPAQRLTRRPEATQAVRLAQWRTRPELRVTTEEVEGLLRAGWRALDTRAEREYQGETPYGSPVGGHLEGAQHLDWSTLLDGARLLSRDALLARFKAVGVTPEARSFVYCTGGVRSAFVYLALRSLGARKVRNYDGSWWAWSRQLSSSQR
jgi:thiosulfate/3-mercaptopyruvate sulfurtransferase